MKREQKKICLRRAAALCCAVLLLPNAAALAQAPRTELRAKMLLSAQETPEIRFSHAGGVYPESWLNVRVLAPAGYRIACTTDGSAPTAADDRGTSDLLIHLEKRESGYLLAHREQMFGVLDRALPREDGELPGGTVLRVALLDGENRVAARDEQIYFLGEDFARRYPGCLVLSLWTDPENLLDEERGLLNLGIIYADWVQSKEGREAIRKEQWWLYQSNATQHGRAWERPCRLSVFNGGSAPAAEIQAGLRIHGDSTRRMSQKAFSLYFRFDGALEWPLFEGAEKTRSLILQAGGDTAEGWKVKDCLLQSLAQDSSVTAARSRPAVLFLNGEYWGPYLLMEKVSGRLLRERFGVRQAVIVKNGSLETGEEEDLEPYRGLAAFAEQDLSQEENYRAFCACADVESFAAACAYRIYIGDGDWGWEANEILWRDKAGTEGLEKWHWMLYDLGCSAGTYADASTAVDTDHFLRAMERYPLFAAALRNESFRRLFYRSLRETAEELCPPERVEQTVEAWETVWTPLMEDCYRRWTLDPGAWERGREESLAFFRERKGFLLPAVIRDLRELEQSEKTGESKRNEGTA